MTSTVTVSKTHRIGITSIGSGVGQSIADACRISQLPLLLHAYGNEPLAFGNFDCDEQRLLPTIYDPQYLERLLAQCVQDRIGCLIPGLDDELLLLAQWRERFQAAGVYIPIASESVLRLCRDKVTMSQVLNPIADCFVESFQVAEAEQRLAQGTLSWPLIAKPIGGFASRGVTLLRSHADLVGLSSSHIIQTLALPEPGDPAYQRVIQRLSVGQLSQEAEWSAQLVIGRHGQELGRFLSYNRLRGGVPVEIVPCHSSAIWSAIDSFLPYLLAQGLTGPLNVQGRLTASGPRFFEMNARFTGITGLRAMLGFNEVAAVIADSLALPVGVQLSSSSPRKVGVRQVANRVVDTETLLPQASVAMPKGTAATHTQPKRVLVTGARGFLGRALLKALQNSDNPVQVIAVTRSPVTDQGEHCSTEADSSDADAKPSAVRWITWDSLKTGSESIGQVDVICHLASARPGADPEAFAASIEMTRQLVVMAVAHQVPGFVYASSQAVYGTQRKPLWRETDTPAPDTPYAVHKLAGEMQSRVLSDLLPQARVSSVRFAQLYGGSDLSRTRETPHAMLQRALSQGYLVQQGGEQTLDLLSVGDAAVALSALLRLPLRQWPACLNVGSGAPMKVADVVVGISDMVQRATGKAIRIEQQDAVRATSFGMDTSLCRSVLGWHPTQPLDVALAPYLQALLAERASPGPDLTRSS